MSSESDDDNFYDDNDEEEGEYGSEAGESDMSSQSKMSQIDQKAHLYEDSSENDSEVDQALNTLKSKAPQAHTSTSEKEKAQALG